MKKLLLAAALLASTAIPAAAQNTAIILWNGADVETATGFGSADLAGSNLGGITVSLSFVNRGTNPNQLTGGNINIDNTTANVETLHMIVGADGYAGPSAHFALTGGVVGTNGASDVTGSYFIDASNSLNGTSESITGVGINAFDSGPLTGVDSFAFNGVGFDLVGGAYGMAERLDLVLQPFSGVAVQGISIESTAVPEPATWAMMALGFGGLAFFGVKRARKDRLASLA